MISNKYRQELIDFLENALKYIDVAELAKHYNNANNWKYDELLAHTDCYYKLGASKIVLCFDEFDDIVIKIPFTGHFISGEYEEFYYAGLNVNTTLDNDWDYCEAEMTIFQEIESDYPELTDFFCETEFLGYIQEHPFYIQERVKTVASKMDSQEYLETYSPSEENIKSLSESLEYSDFIGFLTDKDDTLNIFGVSCDNYGIDLIKELIEFCDKHIEDLHNSNYGFNNEGVIQIFDYCGFND